MEESVEQIDPTSELTAEVVKKRASRGAAILTIRTIFIQAVSFGANALLTIFLNPSQYGVYFLVSAIINFLAYFSDIGFAAALIQKRDKLTRDDLETVFTAQQVLVILVIVATIAATPLFESIYHFNQEAIYLFWALSFSLFTSSLKTIPSVLMERRLEFNKLVIPQFVETLLFNIVVVICAFKGLGVTSFTIAVIVRALSGLATTYMVEPWRPGFNFSRDSFKSIMKFGIPYQANSLMAMAKDDGMTLFLGGVLGSDGIGLLGWAQKWAYAPLRFFMDQVIKVTFPAYSRLQHDRKELSNVVSKSIFYIALLVFPTLVILAILSPSLVMVIPKYNKWSPALVALMLISITSAFAAVTTPITNLLNAVGKISVTFRLMIMWTALTWAFVPALSILYGINGAAAGFALVGVSSIVGLYIGKKYVDINYFSVLYKPILGSAAIGIVSYFLKTLLPLNIFFVIGQGIVGLLIYSVILLILQPDILRVVKEGILKR